MFGVGDVFHPRSSLIIMTTSVYFTLSNQAVKELKDLAKRVGARSVGDVIRSSLSLMMFLRKQQNKGYEIIIQEPSCNRCGNRKEKLLTVSSLRNK